MKNTKAVFLIILGSFLLATGFAYAKEDGPAMQDLKAWVNDSQSVVVMEAAGVKDMGNLNQTKSAVNLKAAIDNTTKDTKAAATTPAPKSEEKKPTFAETAKKWTKDNFDLLVASAAIGFLGFLIIGTGIGGLLVGLAFFGFIKTRDGIGA